MLVCVIFCLTKKSIKFKFKKRVKVIVTYLFVYCMDHEGLSQPESQRLIEDRRLNDQLWSLWPKVELQGHSFCPNIDHLEVTDDVHNCKKNFRKSSLVVEPESWLGGPFVLLFLLKRAVKISLLKSPRPARFQDRSLVRPPDALHVQLCVGGTSRSFLWR